MKQSIYRFRQAEVSVMRRAVATIRLCNSIESNDTRLDHLRQAGCGRDPRPVGAGGETGSFSNEHTGEESAPHTFVPFNEEDVEGQPAITGDRLLRRIEGHIDLTSNHRTRHDLMESMNDMFDEVFDLVITRFPATGMLKPNASALHVTLKIRACWNGSYRFKGNFKMFPRILTPRSIPLRTRTPKASNLNMNFLPTAFNPFLTSGPLKYGLHLMQGGSPSKKAVQMSVPRTS